MPIVELIRLEENSKDGTFGVLKINKQVFCVTLELPDRLNRKNRSSIPAQQYICIRRMSKYGSTFEVADVPGRSAILFHPGNVVEETKGCILLAQHFGKLREKRAILNSGNTFRQFMGRMANDDRFHLTIREIY